MITIAIWNKCNNNCLMCTNPPGYKKEKDYDYEKLIDRYKNLDSKEREIYLTGGEPTFHPRFFNFLNFLRKKCPKAKITIVTNGRFLSYPSFAKKCLTIGNVSFQIAVHGAKSSLHDKITGVKGSFEETVKGIKNLLDLRSGQSEIELRIIMHKLTFPHVRDIYQFLIKNFSQTERIVFIFMEMEGMAGVNIKKIGIKYKDARPYLEEMFSDFEISPLEIRLYHFPLCTLPPKFWPYVWRTLPSEEIVYLPICERCEYKTHCLGIHKLYPEYMGTREFSPIKERNPAIKITNNFHHPIEKI